MPDKYNPGIKKVEHKLFLDTRSTNNNLYEISHKKNIELKGIMALPRLYEDNTRALQEMKMIIDLSKRLQKKYPNASEISLGTTCDFKNAIISGSTMLRIGESIFGKRK